MADLPYDIKHNFYAGETNLLATPPGSKRLAYAQDTEYIYLNDAGTWRKYPPLTRLSDQTGVYGASLIGVKGITGITPTGGSAGTAGNLQAMLEGFGKFPVNPNNIYAGGITGITPAIFGSGSIGDTATVNSELGGIATLLFLTQGSIPTFGSGVFAASIRENGGATVGATAMAYWWKVKPPYSQSTVVILRFPNGFTFTSSKTDCTIEEIPAAIQYNTAGGYVPSPQMIPNMLDNGAPCLGSAVFSAIDKITLTKYQVDATGGTTQPVILSGFTASGNKGLNDSFTYIYPLALT